ncbi:MAG: hypothetical protein IPK61_07275 [Saprospiraceae bacterium]|nr:hypothetical protein [Saprospiraceae bacterium]
MTPRRSSGTNGIEKAILVLGLFYSDQSDALLQEHLDELSFHAPTARAESIHRVI